MPENMTFSILANEVSQIGPKPHVCNCRLVVAPLLDWEAFEEHETFAVEKFGAYGFQQF